jgi:hypothetical protein
MPKALLSYTELADRIHQVLGHRPAEATLRAAAANWDRPGRGTAVTTGMPAPLSHRDALGRAQFDAVAVEAWLEQHPQLAIRRHQRAVAEAPFAQRAEAVGAARVAGVSWQEIADACGAADHRSYTRQWAQQRYGRVVS